MNEKNIYIVRCGEVALKGMNKPYFEKKLADRVRNSLADLGLASSRAPSVLAMSSTAAFGARVEGVVIPHRAFSPYFFLQYSITISRTP